MQPVLLHAPGRHAWQFAWLLLFALLIVGAPAFAATQRNHTIQKGDTLSSVARTYSVSTAELAKLNGLKPTSRIIAGQKLSIPPVQTSPSSTPTPTASGPLTTSVQKAINAPKATPGRWRYIIIHHSGTSEGSAAGMNQYHLRVRHMENGLAYHFVIGNGHGMPDGEIYVGNRWKKQLNGGHLASETQNTYSIGICLVGNFDKEQPTTRQLASLKALTEALERRCNLTSGAVKTHQQINVIHTRCPGERFPTESFLRSLRSVGAN